MKFNEFDDATVRRLVEYIRVMADNKLIVVLKGGIPIEVNINESE